MTDIYEKYLKIKELIIKNLDSSLLKSKYKKQNNYLEGHCYVASEAAYHLLGGKKSGLKPATININGITHWYLILENTLILDPTEEQFDFFIPYHQGRSRGFLTKEPSLRTQVLLEKIKYKE